MSDYPYGLDVRPLTTWPGLLTPADRRPALLCAGWAKRAARATSQEVAR